MLNILKILRISHLIILIPALTLISQAHAQDVPSCDVKQLKKKNSSVMDVICDQALGRLYLKYSPNQRKIWIESESGEIHKTIRRLEKNANPERIGADKNIRFITRKPVIAGQKHYIGLIVAERSMRGDGGGQCGAGSEEYFLAYRLAGNVVTEIHRSLIYSCIQGMILDSGDGNNNDFSVTFDGKVVEFKWLNYPGTDLYTLGHYDFTKNKLEITTSPP